MNEKTSSLRNGVFCCLVFLGCYLLAWPVANMAFRDDWSYIETARVFAQTGHIVYNGWATAMLGWMIPWGALFIKLFGFSFMAVKLSMLPLALGCLLLFHASLRRFEITPMNAVVGTLTLGLSPLFLPLSASFMTDIPGLFVILLCLYLCQRALAAQTDRAAIGWLTAAALTNTIGGTARQVAWLGVLVMVPCTGWLLRKRRNVLIAALVLSVCGAGAVLYCMQWFAKQPYSIQIPILPRPAKSIVMDLLSIGYTTDLMLAEFLGLLLALTPLLPVWLSKFGRRGDHWIMLLCCGVVPLFIFGALFGKYAEVWPPDLLFSELPPFNDFRFGASKTPWHAALPYLTESAVSLAMIAALLGLVIAVREHRQPRGEIGGGLLPQNVFWLLAPFSVSYVLLLLTLGWQWMAFDRYVIGLVPCAIIAVLTFHQRVHGKNFRNSLIIFLVLFAAGAVAGTHDWFARQRARVEAIQELRAAGVPRTEVDGTWVYDGWTQVVDGGYVDDPRIKIPANAYRSNEIQPRKEACLPGYNISKEFTKLRLKYVIGTEASDCALPSRYPSVHYAAWLPPFWRTIKVERLTQTKTDARN